MSLHRLKDALVWKAVNAVDVDEGASIRVLERHRFTGDYRTVGGAYVDDS